MNVEADILDNAAVVESIIKVRLTELLYCVNAGIIPLIAVGQLWKKQ